MKKIILSFLSVIFFLIFFSVIYLTIFGYETDRFNSLIEKKIKTNFTNTKINLKNIKIKIDIKNFSFFISTINPDIEYRGDKVDLKKIDGYINLRSILTGKPNINKINILSNEIDTTEIKVLVKYFKPSNFKKFFLNEVDKGKIILNLDLYLQNNKIENYEINGTVKNLFANLKNIGFEKSSFIYSIKKDSGVIDNIRGFVNGFQINSGSIEFKNAKLLNIKGDLKSDFNLSTNKLNNFLNKKTLKDFEELQVKGKAQSSFKLNFDDTLKITDYQFEASGNIKKSEIKFKQPKKILFVKKKINDLSFEKTDFKINFDKKNKKSLSVQGFYKLNNNLFQKFDLKHLYSSNFKRYIIKGDFDHEIYIPLINFNLKNKIANISADLEIKKNTTLLKKFSLIEGKNKIDLNNLYLTNKKFKNLNNLSVKTFSNGKYNNDFIVSFDKKIKVRGSKYDASNLTKVLEDNNNSNFFKDINKEVTINFEEVVTNVADIISNFNLIGYIDGGKFNKITSKGEFKDGKYLDVSLKVDKVLKKKILEIYSDLPKPLLSNYKFFDGLSGGQLLLTSIYDSNNSKTNLTIENFKVKDAPGLVKLLSLADFGGMVDALSGEGLSFEKLEISIDKNNEVLNLRELYAIGPSISILMEGYIESKSRLVSLRGTMVPAKTLNKFLSKLPIVGNILIPKEIGEGLFGISFKMKGVPGEIKTTVNPIKTLTPRFIQKALKKTN